MVKQGLHVLRNVGNEYAQFVDIQLKSGATCTFANVYLPPHNNLGRRRLTEDHVRTAC